MDRRLLFVLMALLAVLALPCAAADGDKELTLTVNATINANAELNDDDYHLQDKITVTLTERAVYRISSEMSDSVPVQEMIEHKNSLTASGGGNYKSEHNSGSWTYSPEFSKTENCQAGVYLSLERGKGRIYILQMVNSANVLTTPEEQSGIAHTVASMCATFGISNSPGSDEGPNSNASFQEGLQFSFKPNSTHLSISGSATYNFTFSGDKGKIGTATMNVSYRVESGIPERVEAVLVPKGDYKGWLPMADGGGPKTPGNAMTFDVELRVPKGSKAKEKTAQFEIELHDTSVNAGTCMNSPWVDMDPDLKIIKANNPKLTEISADGQSAKTAKGLKSATITISSFDGAAAGKLSVLARLDGDDGQVIAAHPEGEPDLTDVAIPYDSDENGIADAWEKKNETWGKALNTDDDAEPPGDRHKGDGLTVWEEYRGFQQARKYFRTDPARKDFFACDNIGGKTQMALDRLKALTKLDVHGKLRIDELSQSRIINRNHGGEETHVVDQHGVIINTWGVRGVCEAVGDGPGPPGLTREICIDSTLPDSVTRKLAPGNTKTFPYYVPTVVHELLHTCNVWHHGQCDEVVYWQASAVGGRTSIYEYADEADCGHPENGTRIQAYVEHDTTMVYTATSPFWAAPTRVWIGKKQGEHSGCEDCVMRYDCSAAAVRNASSRFCYLEENQEPVGQGLCISGTGTGVNAPGRAPISRYGDADRSYGNCIDQLCVNDMYH